MMSTLKAWCEQTIKSAAFQKLELYSPLLFVQSRHVQSSLMYRSSKAILFANVARDSFSSCDSLTLFLMCSRAISSSGVTLIFCFFEPLVLRSLALFFIATTLLLRSWSVRIWFFFVPTFDRVIIVMVCRHTRMTIETSQRIESKHCSHVAAKPSCCIDAAPIELTVKLNCRRMPRRKSTTALGFWVASLWQYWFASKPHRSMQAQEELSIFCENCSTNLSHELDLLTRSKSDSKSFTAFLNQSYRTFESIEYLLILFIGFT